MVYGMEGLVSEFEGKEGAIKMVRVVGIDFVGVAEGVSVLDEILLGEEWVVHVFG